MRTRFLLLTLLGCSPAVADVDRSVDDFLDRCGVVDEARDRVDVSCPDFGSYACLRALDLEPCGSPVRWPDPCVASCPGAELVDPPAAPPETCPGAPLEAPHPLPSAPIRVGAARWFTLPIPARSTVRIEATPASPGEPYGGMALPGRRRVWLRYLDGAFTLGNPTPEDLDVGFVVGWPEVGVCMPVEFTLGETRSVEPEVCDDGLDNDADGWTDCMDPRCAESCGCEVAPPSSRAAPVLRDQGQAPVVLSAESTWVAIELQPHENLSAVFFFSDGIGADLALWSGDVESEGELYTPNAIFAFWQNHEEEPRQVLLELWATEGCGMGELLIRKNP